jgi:hypothetical protein
MSRSPTAVAQRRIQARTFELICNEYAVQAAKPPGRIPILSTAAPCGGWLTGPLLPTLSCRPQSAAICKLTEREAAKCRLTGLQPRSPVP